MRCNSSAFTESGTDAARKQAKDRKTSEYAYQNNIRDNEISTETNIR